jgi:hypothetical protein
MALIAKSQPIIDIPSKAGMIDERLDVVGV